MKKKISERPQTSLSTLKGIDISKKSEEEIFNLIAKFMVENRNRMSATSSEIAKYFNISFQRAARILNSYTSQGRLKRDHEIDGLYWLELNSF